MNYDIMTDQELLHYLDLYATDPVIRRLAGRFSNTESGIIAELERAGMNSDFWTFDTDYGDDMSPGDYIKHLHNTIDELESERRGLQRDLDDVTEAYDRLKTRTVIELIDDVHQHLHAANVDQRRAEDQLQRVSEENAKLKDQLNMWARMNRV
jgi:hypothetical protein